MKIRPIKDHKFTIVVKTRGAREKAEADLLRCFRLRDPDGSWFLLRRKAPRGTR